MQLLGFALAALIGLSLGIMGGGGSILTVPVFVYVLRFDPKLAIAMSLPVVGATSLIGALGHWRAGNVNLKTATLFGAIAMIGAYAGARLAMFLTGAMQLALLAVVMLAAAVAMLRSARRDPSPAGAPTAPERPMAIGLLLPVAIAVGLITGVVGIGGGFLVVPALVILARVPMKQAVGTSLLVIAMNSAAGFAGYLGRVQVPWGFMAAFTAIAAMGILAGTYLVRFVSQRALKRAFAAFLLLMGAFILYKNRDALRPSGVAPAAGTVPASRDR
ncbi:MAG TPA: sulfite exporter TauE/SafE family protein [Gemmatimonadaceae bacterium]|nr:sulfite exporter TauE/SafE family protein [Gemmatimonadaceae bacterium]